MLQQHLHILGMVDNAVGDYVMFVVDDILFYNHDIDLAPAMRTLKNTKEVFGIFLKLCPALSICHTADSTMKVSVPFFSFSKICAPIVELGHCSTLTHFSGTSSIHATRTPVSVCLVGHEKWVFSRLGLPL